MLKKIIIQLLIITFYNCNHSVNNNSKIYQQIHNDYLIDKKFDAGKAEDKYKMLALIDEPLITDVHIQEMCRLFVIYHDTVAMIKMNNIDANYCTTKCIEQLWLDGAVYFEMSQVSFSTRKFSFKYQGNPNIKEILKQKILNIKQEKEDIDFSLRKNYGFIEYKKDNVIYANHIPLDSAMMLLLEEIKCHRLLKIQNK